MAIESYRAAEKQLAAESRSELFPGIEIVVAVMRKAAGLGGLEPTKLENLSLDAIQKNSKDNLNYLFESLVEDVARIDVRLEAFESVSKAERDALDGLISEAVARAAEAKSKDRVRRVARILANAFRSGPKENYEIERELIDAAVQIAESDAAILGVIMKHQGAIVKGTQGIADINAVNETWKRMLEQNREFRDPHIHVSCARLQSQGLVVRMERISTTLNLATNPYSLTTFGVQFCEWCLQEPAN